MIETQSSLFLSKWTVSFDLFVLSFNHSIPKPLINTKVIKICLNLLFKDGLDYYDRYVCRQSSEDTLEVEGDYGDYEDESAYAGSDYAGSDYNVSSAEDSSSAEDFSSVEDSGDALFPADVISGLGGAAWSWRSYLGAGTVLLLIAALVCFLLR